MPDPVHHPRQEHPPRDDSSAGINPRRGRRIVLLTALAVVVVIALVGVILFKTAY